MTEHHHLPSELDVPSEAPDRNLALELVRVTEAAAMAAGRWVGRGDKNGADGAAVRAMRTLVSTVSMNGVVVIDTVWTRVRMARTAAPSAPFLSPRPTQRPAAIAAASVTRTSSRARLRSGASLGTSSSDGR